jgi:hypothetical protein
MREIRVIMAGCPDRFLERVILPCEAEDVPDVRERLAAEIRCSSSGRESEALGDRPPKLNVVVTVWLLGHQAVHLLDLGLPRLDINGRHVPTPVPMSI